MLLCPHTIDREARSEDEEQVRLRISGMTCVNCTQTIQRSLSALEGVRGVDVNLATETATVDYDPVHVDIRDLERAVKDAGYGVVTEGTRGDVERELLGKRNRFLVGILVGGALMVWMNMPGGMPGWAPWAMLAISAPAFVFTSHQIFSAAVRSLRHRVLNMDVMYSMGIGVAFSASVLATVGVLPMEFIFYETALMLAAFLMIGRYLEARAKGRTSEAIRKLVGLQPRTARVVHDGQELEVAVEEVAAGDVVVTRPGERLAAEMLRGRASRGRQLPPRGTPRHRKRYEGGGAWGARCPSSAGRSSGSPRHPRSGRGEPWSLARGTFLTS